MRKLHFFSTTLVITGLLLGALSASAADYYWTNKTASANFTNNTTVWGVLASPPAGGPGINDNVNFTNAATYTVLFSNSVWNANAYFNAFSGIVTQNIGAGFTWTLTNSYVVAGNLNTTSTVRQALAGTLAVTNGGSATMIVGDKGRGTYILGDGTTAAQLLADSLIIGRTNQNAAAAGFFVQTNSSATILGNMLVGKWGTGTYSNSGTTATNMIYGNLILGEQTTGTGTVFLSGGLVTVTNNGTTGKLIVGQTGYGALTLNSGTLQVDNLLVTNVTLTATNSFLNLTSGTLISGGATLVIPTNSTLTQIAGGTWLAQGNTWVTTPTGTTRTNARMNVTGALALDSSSSMVISNAALFLGNGGKLFVTNGATLQVLGRYATTGSGAYDNFGVSIGNGLLPGTATGVVAGAGSLLVVSNELSVSVGQNRNNSSLLITNGGKVVSGSGALAVFRASGSGIGFSNTIQVLDTGSYWINQGNLTMVDNGGGGTYNQLIVANGGVMTNLGIVYIGTGTANTSLNNGLQVTNGGLLYVQGGIIARDANSLIVVRDAGSRLQVAGGITNGLGNVGEVISLVNSGSVIMTTSGGKLVLGAAAGGAGTLSFNGLGGAVTNGFQNATVVVGSGGTGSSLVLTNGAWAYNTGAGGLAGGITADIVQFGGTAAQSGTLAINSGGLLAITNSSTFGAFNAGGGTASIGANDNVGTAIVAINPGGTLLLTDTGLIVGDTHNGGLMLNGGSLVVTNVAAQTTSALASLIVGKSASVTGALTVAQSGLLQNGSTVVVGQSGQGTLELSNLTVRTSGTGLAGDLSAANFTVGQNASSGGTLTLSGTTTFTLTNDVTGGAIDVTGDTLTLGSANAKGGFVLNTGSTLEITNTTVVVNNGALILNGGVIANSLGTTTLQHLWATNSTSVVKLQAGTLTTLGSSTLLTNSVASMTLGVTGPAAWNVFGGTNVITWNNNNTYILGANATAPGFINVSNAVLNVTPMAGEDLYVIYGALTVGNDATLNFNGGVGSWLSIIAGGGFTNLGVANLKSVTGGLQITSTNALNGGTITVTGDVMVGLSQGGAGRLIQTAGVLAVTGDIKVMDAIGNTSSAGTFTLSGGSVLNTNGWLRVGMSTGPTGDPRTYQGLVTVGGGLTLATWSNQNGVGVANLNGAASGAAPSTTRLGNLVVTNNGVFVTAGNLDVLVISNVARAVKELGTGTVSVVNGGLLQVLGNLNLGTNSFTAVNSNAFGTATLNVGYVGEANASRLLVTNSGETATLYLGGSTNSQVAGGSAVTSTLNLNSGTLTVDRLIATNGSYTTVNLNGGALITKSTIYSNGAAFTVGGTLAMTNALNGTAGYHRFLNGLTVNSGGTLQGNGTVVGTATISTGGALTPGFSMGTMTFSNGLTLNGAMNIELNNLSGTTGTGDFVRVIGTLNLAGGTINITVPTEGLNNNVYVFGQYDTLEGTLSGTTGIPTGYTLQLNYNSLNQLALVGGSSVSWVFTNTASADWNDATVWDTGTIPSGSAVVWVTNDNIAAATTLRLTNATVAIAALTVSNNTSSTHTVLLSNTTLQVGSGVVVGPNAIVQIGAGSAAATLSNMTLTLASGGQIVMTNSQTGTPNQLMVAGVFSNTAGSTLSFAGATGASNLVLLSRAGFVFTNNGILVSLSGSNFVRVAGAANAGTNSLQGGVLTYQNTNGEAQALNNTGTILYSGGALDVATLTNAGTLKVTGSQVVTNANTIINSGGTLDAGSGLFANAGTLGLNGGNLSGTVSNSGTIKVLGGTFIGGAITNSGALNAELAGGNGTISSALANLSGGTVNATNGTLTVTPAWQNSGEINVRAGAGLAGGIVTNASGATINSLGGGTIGSTLANLAGGTINATNGTLTVTPAWQNSGTINLANSATLTGGTLTNAAGGAINYTDGAYTLSTTWMNEGGINLLAGSTNQMTSGATYGGAGVLTNVGGVLNAGGNATIGNATLANLAGGIINATNGTLQIGGDTVNAGLINVGKSANAAVLSNNNLYLTGSGVVALNGGGGLLTPDTLIVANTFTNTTSSAITNAGGGAVRLKFLANQNVINSGTMAFLMTTGAATNQMLTLTIGDSSDNFLVNSGSLVLGIGSGAANRTFAISNQFYNTSTGWFVITNAPGAAGGAANVIFTGSNGGTSTNAGTFRMVQVDGTSGANAGTNTFLNGSFLNSGTLTVKQVNNNTAAFIVAQAGASFTNADGGQVILEQGGTGTFVIRADNLVNLGTNALNSGTLMYLGAAGVAGSGTNLNSGTILFSGGYLNVNMLTNAGTLKVTGSQIITNANTIINDGGALNSGSSGLLVNSGTLGLNGGNLSGTISNYGTIKVLGGTFTGGAITNNSAINAELAGGIATIDSSLANLSSGIINATNGTVTVTTDWQNSGVIHLRAGAGLDGGFVTNVSGATINPAGGGKLGSVYNSGTLNVTNGTLQVSGDAVNASRITLGNGTTAVGTLSNNNLYLVGTGTIIFSNSTSATGPSTLLVANTFTNTTGSVISNYAGGGVALTFSGNAVTNQGLISIFASGPLVPGGAGLVLQVGSTGEGQYYNTGTNVLGLYTGSALTSRTFYFSNQFVNAGTLILTNSSTGTTATNLFSETGGTLTNSGVVLLQGAGGGTIKNLLTITSGGWVNDTNATLTSDVAAGKTNLIVLAGDNVFSNAGQVVVNSGGALQIWADAAVNTGTNALNSGTLNYLSAAGGNTGVLQNAGSILYQGGYLNVSVLTNLSSGVISNTGANATFVWAANTTNYNSGTIATGSGVLTNFGAIYFQGGYVGGIVSNANRIDFTDATTTVDAVLLNGTNGTINVQAGGTLFTTRSLTNNVGGTYNLLGGTIRDAEFVNAGKLVANGGTINRALINETTGYLLATTGTTTLDPDLINRGWVTNSATLLVTNSAGTTMGVVNNSGTFVFAGGTLAAGSVTNTGALALVGGSGTLTSGGMSGSQLVNAGSITLANGQYLTFVGMSLTNSTGYVVGNGGTLAFDGASFYNESTAPTSWNMVGSTLLFTNNIANSSTFTVAGADLGKYVFLTPAATNNNYFVSNLNLAGGNLDLGGTHGLTTNALYVANLNLADGTVLNLNGARVYYQTLTGSGTFTGSGVFEQWAAQVAANYYWTNTTASGLFTNNTVVWESSGGVPVAPGIQDSVFFTNNLTYTVSFTNAAGGLYSANAYFSNTVAGAMTVATDLAGKTWTVTNQYIMAPDSGNDVTVSQAGGTLAVTNAAGNAEMIIGRDGQGFYRFAGGTTAVVNRLILGQNPGSDGAMDTWGSGWGNGLIIVTNGLGTGQFIIGDAGTGNASLRYGGLSGQGSKLFADELIIGNQMTGVGTLTMDGETGGGVGLMQVSNMVVGAAGTGVYDVPLNQKMNYVVSSTLVVGRDATGAGTVTYSGSGSLLVTNSTQGAQLIVGQNGAGTFVLSSTLVADKLIVATNAASAGTFTWTSGTMSLREINGTVLNGGSPTSDTNTIINGVLNTLTTGNAVAIGTNSTQVYNWGIGWTNVTSFDNGLVLGVNTNSGGGWSLNGANQLMAVTNSSGTAKLIVGQSGYGVFTLNNAGATLLVDNLLVTNNTLTATNSFLNLTAGTLISGGATLVIPTNGVQSVGGTWLAKGNTWVTTPAGATANNALLDVTALDVLALDSSSVMVISNAALRLGGDSAKLFVTNGAVLQALGRWDSGGSGISSNYGVAIGYGANNATGVVAGAGSLLVVSNELAVSSGNNRSYNSLLITNGGKVVSGSGALAMYRATGHTGLGDYNTIQVLDSGSYWINQGNLVMAGDYAYGSNNQLIVANSGVMTNLGDVTIGTGSDSQYRNFNNGLQVTNGGLLYVGGGILAQDVAGIIVVRDNGSRLMANNLTNSAAGGNITVADNGQMTLQQLVLGSVAAATNNLLTVSGGSLFATNSGGTGALVVGLAGQGTLTLSSGAVTVNQLLVTNNALNGATNSVFNFDGGTLTTSNNAIAAQIVLADNAYFQINGTWNMNGGTNLIYSTGTATGTVYVGIAVNNATVNVGPNAVWSLGTNATSIQNLTIGLGLYRGNAVVVNGGLITNVAALNMGASAGGINFSWGSSLTISNGGKVFVSGGALTFPVSFYSSNNAVNVIGSGARLDLNGGAVTMGGSSGTLTISGGGVVKSGAAALGSQSGGNDNMVIVEGNGSAWTNTGLTIGFEGNRNSLIITNGGQVVSSGNIAVGSMGSANSILVAGTGSMLTGGVVTIGLDSAGNNNSVIVTNGGTVLSGSIVVGIYAGNNGGVNDNSVLIAGPGSSWTNSGTTLIKRGLATLSVSNGATFVSGDVSFGAVPEGTNQTYNVGGGANSVFVTNGAITIGFASVTAGNNAMNVTNATLLSGAVTIGAGSADNTVTVQNDATWDLLGNSLTVGSGAGGSNNTLTIQGGTVAATGLVMSATANGNVVNITGGTLFVTNSAGNSRFWVGQSGQGSVTMGGGSLTANYLLLTNSAASVAGYGWLTATAITNQGTLRASGGGNLIVDGVIAGAGTNYAENGGTLTLRGINTYTSPTWLNGGTVVITTNANLGPNSAPLLFYSGGTLQVLSNATLAASRSIVLRAGGGTIDTSNQSTIVAGVLDGDLQNVGGGLTKMGSGMLTLLETNTYTGATQIREGQVVLAQAGGLRASTISNAVHGGLVFSNVATAFNIGGLAGSGNIGLTNTAGNAVALTVGGNGESTRYSGALSGAGSLTVNGGILELTGNNHYTGVTIVTNGALNVNNATGIGMTGDVFVYGSGDGTRAGTLGGTGSIGGVVTVETGGRIAPGNSVGTLNVATLTLNSGSVLDFEFNPALLATNDKIIVGNAAGLTINGGQFYILREGFPEPPVEDLTAGAFFTRGTYNLIGYRGVIGGTGIDALSVLNQAEGYTYLFDVAGGYVRLTIGATNLTGWSGLSGTTSNWTDAANWDGDVPVSGSKLLFSGYTRLTNYNDNTANTVFNGITFDSTADKFMLTGNAIGLSGNVSNNSSRTQTINLDLALTGNRVFATTNKGGIVVNGNISDGGSGFGLIKTGGQRLTLTGVNTYTGVTEIQGGALQAAVADAGLPNASNLKINGGVFESSGTFSRSLGTGAGQVQWAGSGGFSAHGGDLSVNIGGAGGALKWNGTSGFVTDSQKLIFSFNAESATSYQPDRASNTVNMINPIDLNGGMRTVQVNNGHATIDVNMVNGFTNSTGTGGLTKTGSGAMLLSGTSTYDGNTVINGGELVMAGTLSSAGSVFVYAGGALMMDSGTVNTDGGVFINSGGYLGGNAGAIHDEVTVAKGGVLTPGMRLTGWDEPGLRETGALQVDRLTLQGGFKYNWELSLIGTDRVDVAALDGLTFVNSENWTLNLGLNYSGEDFGQGKWDHWFSLDATTNVYTLFTFNGAAPYDLTNNVNILGFEWYTNYARVYIEGNKVLLTGIYLNEKLMVIPEPSVVLLWLSSIATVVAARRRARRKAAA